MIVPTRFSACLKRGFMLRTITSVVPKSDIIIENDFGVTNEPCLSYLPNSPEMSQLKQELTKIENQEAEDIPIVIGGKEYRTDNVQYQPMPHNHRKKVAKFYHATPELIKKAIETSLESKILWEKIPLGKRLEMFLKVADEMATKHRSALNATTMLGQAKTVIQAEIDSAAELVDFFRFNAYFGKEICKYQPISEKPEVTLNLMRYRSLDGFIASISPFNFTAIAGNLAYTPAIMGNGIVWKPSDSAILSNYLIFKIFRDAGIPDGVVNFVPSAGIDFGKAVTGSPNLAAINFTGSVPTFQWLWKAVGNNLTQYAGFPRMIGECGGKNFHFVHPSADIDSVITSTIRSAFEYQGQKCSACSRLYVPQSLWPKIKEGLIERQKMIKMGSVTEFDSFMSAVIDAKSFNRCKSYIEEARKSSNLKILAGGNCDDSIGYFVEPTIVETTSTKSKIFTEEIFGPILTVYVFKDEDIEKTLQHVSTDTLFGLTGSVYSNDQEFANHAAEVLKFSCGNFYVNDKCTGSIVGQQPFGGAKHSGTNDKAGGPHYMLKWASPQAIKQTFVPLKDVNYPYMDIK